MWTIEPTLSLKKADLESFVGNFFGWGRGAVQNDVAWSISQQAVITDCVATGCRRVYKCSPLCNWSFLRPSATFTLVSGKNTITMPDDFGGIEGRVSISSTSQGCFRPIEFDNPGKIDELYSATPNQVGIPIRAAIQPMKGTALSHGQQQQFYVFPIADQNYQVKFTYYINPNYLDGTQPYVYGGSEHTETFKMSCLAYAEEFYNRVPNGPNAMAFARELQSSMMADKRKKPVQLGVNSDTSDDGEWLNRWDENYSTVNYTPGV